MPKTTPLNPDRIVVLPGRLRALRPKLVNELAESLSQRGLLQPITVRAWHRGHSLVLGRHRLEAAKKLKWKAIDCFVTDLNDDEARLNEIDENLARGELTQAERKIHTGERAKVWARIHGSPKAKGAHAANKKMKRGHDATAQRADAFTTETAKKTGKAQRTVRRDVQHAKDVVVLKQIVGTSLDKEDEIRALAKLSPAVQKRLAKQARAAKKTGKKVSAKLELKQLKRKQKERELARKQIALPDKKYGVIVADPEWQFEPWSRKTGLDRAADNHYPTSTLEVIKSRNVASIAAKDCVLFLWATGPMMPHALLVMAAWGFDYKSQYVWEKDKAGTGYWNRERHELLLIGTHGDIPCPAPGKQWESVIRAPRGAHSAKPVRAMKMIEEYFPNLPKIELNCRGKPRKGWEGWGLEAKAEETKLQEAAE